MPAKRRLSKRRSDAPARLLDETIIYLDSGDDAALVKLNLFYAVSLGHRQAEEARAAWLRGDVATAVAILAALAGGHNLFQRR